MSPAHFNPKCGPLRILSPIAITGYRLTKPYTAVEDG